MSEDIFRKLQERLDLYSMGFPATASGIELKILRYLFSEDDADMFLALSHSLITQSMFSALIMMALFTTMIGPIFFRALMKKHYKKSKA